jgi:hypothetical protein
MNNKIKFLILNVALILTSCGIFKTHDKDKLINFENNDIATGAIQLDGYYYIEFEREAQTHDNVTDEKVKCIDVFYIYEDGYLIYISRIDGVTKYICAGKETFENSFKEAHRTVELMVSAHNNSNKKRMCRIDPLDVHHKGLVKIDRDNIKIQFYQLEHQIPGKDSFNSAYLYELNGTVISDSSFTIQSETEFRNNKTTAKTVTYKFKKTENKPNLINYFRSKMKKRS